ncbi:MAG: PEP-CTERM sorting domain-containing protein, partial [Betaproteobacteria bacterium]
AEGFDYAWVPPDELSLSFDGRTLAVAVVPEPSTYGLMLAGLGLVAWLKRRRDGAAAATR